MESLNGEVNDTDYKEFESFLLGIQTSNNEGERKEDQEFLFYILFLSDKTGPKASSGNSEANQSRT